MIYPTKNGVMVDDVCLDPRRALASQVNFVSHAHSDHLPRKVEASVISTEITQTIARQRKCKFELRDGDLPSGARISLLDAGHVPGAAMCLIENGYNVLYTGDFSTRKKYFSDGAKPVKVDALIVDSTFGDPNYVFPKTSEVVKEMRDWIDSCLRKDKAVALFGYPFGKAQEICAILDGLKLPYQVVGNAAKFNELLGEHGIRFKGGGYDESGAGKRESIMVMPTTAYNHPLLEKHEFSKATLSGWAVEPSYRYQVGVDAAFALSDHCDFPELVSFIEKCAPETVYCMHGFGRELAYELRTMMHIDARAI